MRTGVSTVETAAAGVVLVDAHPLRATAQSPPTTGVGVGHCRVGDHLVHPLVPLGQPAPDDATRPRLLRHLALERAAPTFASTIDHGVPRIFFQSRSNRNAAVTTETAS